MPFVPRNSTSPVEVLLGAALQLYWENTTSVPLLYFQSTSSVSGISRLSFRANLPPRAVTEAGAVSPSAHWMLSR